ncbi:hybrid sensor histidine kinase/response regulator [Mucilaginibacter aquatilis]|uniref:Sensory/regulatory protein RpfC n=1 Tax=Mucilaginibacter aquatilis TaxID=1517760 RepID=A0A6I4IQT4_9SPHI|nr:response regulator [Mucilaginibacter aquatilis]MVN91694.1 response regulator [Mucilaginibacter aquatilis]
MSAVNILVVDDREENIVALEALLRRDDINIISTTSPNEALRIAWENQISIALVDVQMPEIDGFELVEMLKANPRTKDILIIFVTAISKESKYAVKGFGTGAVDYLYKPLDPYITSAKVDAFIQLAQHQKDIKEKNEELQNYAIMVKNSADIITTVDAKTFRILSINQAVKKLLGYQVNELEQTSIVDMAVPDDQPKLRKKLSEIVNNNMSFAVAEYQLETFDKRTIWAECRITYNNKILFINISDVSPQKSYQQELIKSKEAAEHSRKVKESFLANMSHELRTPVNGILGLTNMLRKGDLDEHQRNIVDLLDVSSQSLLGVINDVLDISKIEAGKFSIIRKNNNVRQVVQATFDLLKYKADEKNIDLLLEIDSDVPQCLLFDALRLNQILMNLLSNAIKFTERGYVKLVLSVLQNVESNVKVKFSVIDTGIGIATDRLAKIFESFEQAEDDTLTKYGGTGLGLTIVKKLIELKGGELTVSSQIGSGSVFNFTNWYAVADAPKAEKIDGNKQRSLTPFIDVHVLVAEDNLVNQFMMSKMLKDWNVNFEIVDNGQKVLDKLLAKDFDLILMDTHMPEMNGYDAAKTIRMNFAEPKRSIPIISLSAATFDHEQQQALSAGMNDILSKPFQPYQLHEKMQHLLEISKGKQLA